MADPWAGISGLGWPCRSQLCASEPATLVVPGSGELYLGISGGSVANSGSWTMNTKAGAPTAAVTVTILSAWARA